MGAIPRPAPDGDWSVFGRNQTEGLTRLKQMLDAGDRSQTAGKYAHAARSYLAAGDLGYELLQRSIDPRYSVAPGAGAVATVLASFATGFGWHDLILGGIVTSVMGRHEQNRAREIAEGATLALIRELECSARCPELIGSRSKGNHFLRRWFLLYTEVNPPNPVPAALVRGIAARVPQVDILYPEMSEMLLDYAVAFQWSDVLASLAGCGYRPTSGGERQRSAGGDRHSTRGTGATRMDADRAFALLGLSKDASLEQVRRAYHAKVAEWHPDRLADMASELRDLATERMKELNEAYELICNLLRT